MVYLVGAGPGDPELITVKALNILRQADVVLYDRLAEPSLLLETRPGAILIDVGKHSGLLTKSQNEISSLLVEYGGKELTVVRLKGGDPFLFGRGGEEAERLSDENIPFTVVPGVSALTAAPTYAGIPLTHRDLSSSVGVATGHGAKGKSADPVKWRALAQSVDTIVVFMGVETIDNITQELMAGGCAPETPSVVIERGCTPLQKVVTGTLGTIAGTALAEAVTPPALLVVGSIVSLREKLDWFQPGTLAGITIGITRPLEQSHSFCTTLRFLGSVPVLMPTIRTVPLIDSDDVKRCIEKVDTYDYIVFTSVTGVNFFFQALKNRNMDSRALAGKTIATIGPVTAQALDGHGITADITAGMFIAENLLETILDRENVSGRNVLLVRSDIGRKVLPDGLKAAGAFMDDIPFYSTRRADLNPLVADMIEKEKITVITFTSSSTVEGFFSQFAPEKLGTTLIASIGPETSKTVRKYGLNPDIEAVKYTTEGLACAISAFYSEDRQES